MNSPLVDLNARSTSGAYCLAEHPAKPPTLLEPSLIGCRLLEGIHHPHRVDGVSRVERLNRDGTRPRPCSSPTEGLAQAAEDEGMVELDPDDGAGPERGLGPAGQAVREVGRHGFVGEAGFDTPDEVFLHPGSDLRGRRPRRHARGGRPGRRGRDAWRSRPRHAGTVSPGPRPVARDGGRRPDWKRCRKRPGGTRSDRATGAGAAGRGRRGTGRGFRSNVARCRFHLAGEHYQMRGSTPTRSRR